MKLPETDFDRERQWWDSKAAKEETDSADETINRALRWREIERHLDGVKSILDVGGATGAFSIPLAKRGFQVVHLDLSPEMLSIAREKAGGVPNIEFAEGKASDLSQFSDRAFDLVLNMDGAISFSGTKAFPAIQETCRVAAKMVIVTVSHRAQMAASWVSGSLARTGRIAPGGLGSLASLCDREMVAGVSKDGDLLHAFLDACERFDAEILPCGPGTRLRAGLIAVARRP